MPNLQTADQTILIIGTPVPPSEFHGLIQRHPKGVEIALSLEREARRLRAVGFSPGQLKAFIHRVCQWGDYPRTAERVLRQNRPGEIQERFRRALAVLDTDRPNVRIALRELSLLQHLGVSFASKHLRFLCPQFCPVLDSILSQTLGYALKPRAYGRFSDDCLAIAGILHRHGVANPFNRPGGAWYAADVEMALYVYVKGTRR